MAFNENTRVKIPAILHFCRLGYTYLPLKNITWDESSNIIPDILVESLKRINKKITPDEINKTLQEISLALDNDDLGQIFYQKLISGSNVKLIDFNDLANNSYHVVTELTCKNGEDEFRPDITLFVNGLPLAFVEVKKPNNKEGILAERERINMRFKNKKFNDLLILPNSSYLRTNMEYDFRINCAYPGCFLLLPQPIKMPNLFALGKN